MAFRIPSRKKLPHKARSEPIGLPALIAWSVISALILVGIIQEFVRFQPVLDTTLGLTSILLILCGSLISIGVFKLTRRKQGVTPAPETAGKQHRILEGDISAWWISVISPLENFIIRRELNPNFITLLSFCFITSFTPSTARAKLRACDMMPFQS